LKLIKDNFLDEGVTKMKKGLLIGALVGLVLGALVVAGYAFAQSPTPVPQFPFGGMMGGRQRGGMMGGYGNGSSNGQYGPMHEYMEKAFAEALGISQDDLEAELDGGKTMWQVAQEKGKTLEEFQKLMVDARTNAFKQMVADGVITQAQADWMLSRMQNMGGQGGGRFGGQGGCPGMGGGYGSGSRWNNPSAPSTSPSGSSY
jgi:hypothetical protein